MSRTGCSVTLGLFLLALVNLEASHAASLEGPGNPLIGESQLTVRRLTLPSLEMTSQMKQEAVVHELFASEAEDWVRNMFASARWDFLPDGTVRLLLHSLQKDGQELPVEEIDGTYRRGPGSIEIHVSVQPSLLVLHASLDGVLRETEEGYRLDAVIAVSLLEQWHFEIHQILKPGEPPATSEASVVWIDGIPQPSVFEVQVTGRAGSVEFGPASAIIVFGAPDRFGPLSVGLIVPRMPSPGAMFWSSPSETTRSASYKIEVRDGRVTVHFDRARGEAPEIWWIDPELSNISGDRGRLDVEVHGDEISGELRIETILADTSLIYAAELHGRRRKLSLNAALSLFLPTLPPETTEALRLAGKDDGEMSGLWRIADGAGHDLGELSLHRVDKEQLAGSFRSSGEEAPLAGQMRTGFAEIQQEPGPVAQRWVLRLLPGGNSLLGLRYDLSVGRVETVVGWRPPAGENKSAVKDLSREDTIENLRQGALLGVQGRCHEAIGLLEDALVQSQRHAREREPIPMDQRFFLSFGSRAAFQVLGACDLQSEDYEGYLRHLRLATEVLRSTPDAERQLLLDEIERLRSVWENYRKLLEWTCAELETLCQNFTKELEKHPALGDGVAAVEQELQSLKELLSATLLDLAALSASVRDGRESFTGSANILQDLSMRIRDQERRSFAEFAAELHRTLASDPRLMQEQEALWLAVSSFAGADRSLRDRASEMMDRLKKDLQTSESLTEEQKALAMFQTLGTYILGGTDSLLPDAQDLIWLARASPFRLVPPVELATELASLPESFLSRRVTDRSKVEALEKLQPFFRDLILFLVEENQAREALAVSEISRSRALADLLAGRDKIRQGLETVRARLGADALPSPVAVSPPSLKTILDIVQQRGSTTIEYFLTDQQLLLWVILPDREVRLESRPVNRKALRASIDELRDLLTGRVVADPQRTRELLRSLYSLLIAPVLDHLPSSPEAVLTLIPHQELFGAPFAALQDETGAPLIAQHALTYGTSIATLGQMHKNREALPAGAAPRLLALINPQPLAAGSRGQALPPLDLVESQFSAIAGFFAENNRVVLKGSQATEKALMARTPGPSVLHLVTHGEFVEDDPLSSYIALAVDGEPGGGFLRVPEVFRLDLPADLVVLWACETGRGGISADGVEGLSRGFLWAGAASLLLSLWEVPEQESLIQMYGFHDYWLRQGLSKARALQKAQIEQSRLYPDQPGLWAGFVLYGEAD